MILSLFALIGKHAKRDFSTQKQPLDGRQDISTSEKNHLKTDY